MLVKLGANDNIDMPWAFTTSQCPFFFEASASCTCPKATLELSYYLSANEEKRYIFEFGKNIVVVRIQSGEETILRLNLESDRSFPEERWTRGI